MFSLVLRIIAILAILCDIYMNISKFRNAFIVSIRFFVRHQEYKVAKLVQFLINFNFMEVNRKDSLSLVLDIIHVFEIQSNFDNSNHDFP